MHIIKPDALARPYQLTGLNYMGQPVSTQKFTSLAELAVAATWNATEVARNRSRGLPLEGEAVSQQALNPRGKPLAIAELVAWGQRLRVAGRRSRYHEFEFRVGSVSGIHKWRGGSHTKNHSVQHIRRSNALVVREDGEVPARAARQDRSIPSCWDGRRRIVQSCWKSQHNGGKSWDRPVRHGNGCKA
jgi:hypothetical protein